MVTMGRFQEREGEGGVSTLLGGGGRCKVSEGTSQVIRHRCDKGWGSGEDLGGRDLSFALLPPHRRRACG